MQSINVIIVSVFVVVCAPLILMAFSAYTLYNTLAVADYVKRRHTELLRALASGRTGRVTGAHLAPPAGQDAKTGRALAQVR